MSDQSPGPQFSGPQFSGSGDGSSGDSFTETSSRSWFSRIGGALGGLLLGILLIPGAVWLLSWNEGHAVAVITALNEGSGAVVPVSAAAVDAANQGRLVHVSGPFVVRGTLTDADFAVQVSGAAQLVRTAETFQWIETQQSETRSKLGGGSETVTTSRYRKDWSAAAVDSARFRQPQDHANPAQRVASRTMVAGAGHIGAFTLDRTLLARLGPEEPYALNEQPKLGQLSDGGIFIGSNPLNPVVGDVRLRYTVVRPAAVSVVGQQDGAGFKAATTKNGRSLLLIDPGEVSASAMFKEAQDENRMLTWLLRGAGVVVMLIGFTLLLRPVVVFADVVPLFGSLTAVGAFLAALLATALVAPLVIAIAWIAVRPVVGIGVLVAGAMIAGLIAWRMRSRQTATPSPFFRRS